jgi:hypothetical protein
MTVTVINGNGAAGIEAVQSDRPFDARTLTYGLLRHVLVDSGSIDEREAQKMDRAISRLLRD